MTLLTSLLFIFAAFALFIVALSISRNKSRSRESGRKLSDQMRLASSVACAASADAFGVMLDRSEASLVVLDSMINNGWSAAAPRMEASQGSTAEIDDGLFSVAAYVGELLVEFHQGYWRSDTTTHPLPFVYFTEAELAASPFDFVRRKFEDPLDMDMAETYRRLVEEIASRKAHQASPVLIPSQTTELESEPTENDIPND